MSLVEAIINKILSYSKSHVAILKETFEFHLYVLSVLTDHGKVDSLKVYLDITDTLLCQWIKNPNVIGGGFKKPKEEIEVFVLYNIHKDNFIINSSGRLF